MTLPPLIFNDVPTIDIQLWFRPWSSMMFPLLVFKDVSSGISTVGVQWRFCCWSSIIHKLSLCIIIEVTYKFVPRVILLKFTCIFTPKSPNKYISICSPLRSLLWNNSGIGIVFKYKRNPKKFRQYTYRANENLILHVIPADKHIKYLHFEIDKY